MSTKNKEDKWKDFRTKSTLKEKEFEYHPPEIVKDAKGKLNVKYGSSLAPALLLEIRLWNMLEDIKLQLACQELIEEFVKSRDTSRESAALLHAFGEFVVKNMVKADIVRERALFESIDIDG